MHTVDLQMPAKLVVLTLEKAYLEPVPVNAQKMRDIRRFVPYIPNEHKNIMMKYCRDLYVTEKMMTTTVRDKL
jgi:hypothetical protein